MHRKHGFTTAKPTHTREKNTCTCTAPHKHTCRQIVATNRPGTPLTSTIAGIVYCNTHTNTDAHTQGAAKITETVDSCAEWRGADMSDMMQLSERDEGRTGHSSLNRTVLRYARPSAPNFTEKTLILF